MVKHFFPFRFRIICDTKEVFIVFAKGLVATPLERIFTRKMAIYNPDSHKILHITSTILL